MKKIMTWRIALVALLGVFSYAVQAQAPQQLPIDPQVRVGVLENGLTYYIRHNELPKDRAEFHIAQKVGSMQEEEAQRGLAHFLEHMAFNGTTHYPDKTMLEYLESIGAKFGANVNAYTAFDETVYTLMNIPVTRQGIVDSCLLILYDWSCGIALLDEEIDNERGVIHEEWRTGQNAQMRIFDQVLPVIFEGSRYGHRLPIGLMEVVDNFPHQDIRDYYEKWYRPDLQALIIVGDVDVDYVEGRIKEMFSGIELPENRAERVYHEIPDNREPIVAIATDKELKNVRTTISYKREVFPRELRNTPDYFVNGYIESMMSAMLNARFSEMVQKPNPPFLGAGASINPIMGLSKTKDAFNVIVISDEDHIERAVRTVLEETERAIQHGFNESEYERARANFLNSMESAYNERDKQRNSTYTDEYTRAFLNGDPIPGIEIEYALYNQIAPALPLEAINEFMKTLVTEENIVIVMQGPEKEGVLYPSRDEILAFVHEASHKEMEPYEEELSDEPLIGELPQPGSIVRTERDEMFDATVWTLSNGAKVVVKPTTFKNDQIIMSGFSPGGSSVIGDEYLRELNFINAVAGIGGLGNFSAVNLGKVLAGRNATANASVGELTQNISARCAPRDLETMMQLVYLRFTGVRQDDEAFKSWKTRQIASLRNSASDPGYIFQDSLYTTIYGRHPRMAQTRVEDVEKFDYEKTLDLYRERFANAGDFTFLFIGNIDEQALKPYVEQYLASLPATGEKGKAGQPILMARENITNMYDQKMESPKVSVVMVMVDQAEPSLKNRVEADMLGQILSSRYTETMREEEGGTYSPGASMAVSIAKQERVLQIMFDTNAEQRERLSEIAIEEIEKIAADGPSDVDFNKVKEYMLKKYREGLEENGFWLGLMNNWYQYGMDNRPYPEAVNAITKNDIRVLAAQMLENGKLINVTMNGIAAE